ncbi:MAG: FAD-dependent oxidoreductase, partial [Chitinophagaceae bacterium]|nr:FAD-dependent oxidoreductase [Chitinophagaceae bacterium]
RGFGNVVKVVVEFNKPIWKTGTAFIFSDTDIPTWWTQFPLTAFTLTGWAGGPMADRIANNSDTKLSEIALDSLSHIFEQPAAELQKQIVGLHVYNWKEYAESKGAYSYATTASEIARQTLNTPLDNTIFFAGEGLYDGQYSGTVEAALNRAKKAAQEILSVE